MNKLEELIEEGKKIGRQIYYVEPPKNVFRTYDVYDIEDKECYFLWLNRCKSLLNKYFKGNSLLTDFVDLSKKLSPVNHTQQVSIS